jgi:hypothetical protein
MVAQLAKALELHAGSVAAEASPEGERMQNVLENMSEGLGDQSRKEGHVARSIEQQTAKVPSDAFLWVALGSIGASLGLMLFGAEKKANFVGQWAPTFLILGLYNKMVKLHGSDAA